jgi:hypothetical protein
MMRTVTVESTHDVAVETEQTIIVFGKSEPNEVFVDSSAFSNLPPMQCTTAVDVVYRKKFDRAFAATYAPTAVGSNNSIFRLPVFCPLPGENPIPVFPVVCSGPFADFLSHSDIVALVFFTLASLVAVAPVRYRIVNTRPSRSAFS